MCPSRSMSAHRIGHSYRCRTPLMLPDAGRSSGPASASGGGSVGESEAAVVAAERLVARHPGAAVGDDELADNGDRGDGCDGSDDQERDGEGEDRGADEGHDDSFYICRISTSVETTPVEAPG